jgi:uncharacterized protein (TIGR02231 family)
MVECESKIVQVTVYPGQAQVLRRGRVELPNGSTEVLMPDLPLSLLPESIRVGGRGTALVRLLGVQVSKTRYVVPPEEAVAELDAQIEEIEDEDRVLAEAIEVLGQRLVTLTSLAEVAPERLVRGFTWGRLDLERIEALLAFVHHSVEEITTEVRGLEIKRRQLGRELEQLQRLRQDRQQPHQPDRYTVRIPVEVSQGGEFELELSYVCENATWKPLYDLRLTEAEGEALVALSQLAEVSQRTGEDWDEAQLAVSTARPALTARLPELRPWHIDLYHPAPVARHAKRARTATVAPAAQPMEGAVEDTMAEEAEFAAEVTVSEVEADIATAEVSQDGPAIAFTAPGLVTIPADGTARKVFLGTQELSTVLDWVTAPKIESHVYRRAKVENSTSAVLLPGPASIFFGDAFIGTTRMPETPPEGEIEVYLGVDDRVAVEREQVERSVDKSGVLEKVRRISFAYLIRLHNFRPDRIALTVLDQVPVSRHEDLKVKMLQVDPEVEPDKMGELRWALTLAAGEERELAFSFHVDVPKDRRSTGLD